MDDVREHLLLCFKAVFPNQDDDTLVGLTQDTHAGWDSLASVTLMRLMEEQFDTQLDFSELAELDSFVAFENYIRNLNVE